MNSYKSLDHRHIGSSVHSDYFLICKTLGITTFWCKSDVIIWQFFYDYTQNMIVTEFKFAPAYLMGGVSAWSNRVKDPVTQEFDNESENKNDYKARPRLVE